MTNVIDFVDMHRKALEDERIEAMDKSKYIIVEFSDGKWSNTKTDDIFAWAKERGVGIRIPDSSLGLTIALRYCNVSLSLMGFLVHRWTGSVCDTIIGQHSIGLAIKAIVIPP